MLLLLMPEAQVAAGGKPEVEWIEAIHFTRPEKPREVRYLVMHTIEGSTQAAVSWFRNPKSKVSAHYVVGHDGKLIQMVRDEDIAWHAGNWDYNVHSIGIEHEGYALQDTWTKAQVKASAALARYLCQKYRIPPDAEHIISHQSITPERKKDPGPYFPWEEYFALIRGKTMREQEAETEEVRREVLSKVEQLLEEADRRHRREQYDRAADLYRRIAYNYAEQEYGAPVRSARIRLEVYAADEELMRFIEEKRIEKECRGWLSLARTYRRNQLPGEALLWFEKVAEIYPDTEWGREAARAVSELEPHRLEENAKGDGR